VSYHAGFPVIFSATIQRFHSTGIAVILPA
jgi:hypothetical protein